MNAEQKINRFIKWLDRAGSRGRTMRQYVERFGAFPIRRMIDESEKRGCKISIKLSRRGGAQNHHRIARGS